MKFRKKEGQRVKLLKCFPRDNKEVADDNASQILIIIQAKYQNEGQRVRRPNHYNNDNKGNVTGPKQSMDINK